VVYKPVREKPSGQRPAHIPSWRVPTDPERRWAAYAATVVIIAGQTWVGHILSLTSASDWLTPRIVWIFPLVSAALVAASLAAYVPEHTEPRPMVRAVSLGLLGILVAAEVTSLGLLITDVFRGLKARPVSAAGGRCGALARQRLRVRSRLLGDGRGRTRGAGRRT
jgi:peptidoglycan/LPS O-acetylase OafA/YrhL